MVGIYVKCDREYDFRVSSSEDQILKYVLHRKTPQHRKERSNIKYEDIITQELSPIPIGKSGYLALHFCSTLWYYAFVESPLRLKFTISWFLRRVKDERVILRHEIAASPIFCMTAVFVIYIRPANIRYTFGNLCLDGVTNIFRRL
jgi:hypothetical protein